MDEHDHRQYNRMLDVVRHPSYTLESLRNIVESLAFLLGNLRAPDTEWISKFQQEWWILEENLAFALSEEQKQVGQDAIGRISAALDRMTKLIQLKQEDVVKHDEWRSMQ